MLFFCLRMHIFFIINAKKNGDSFFLSNISMYMMRCEELCYCFHGHEGLSSLNINASTDILRFVSDGYFVIDSCT